MCKSANPAEIAGDDVLMHAPVQGLKSYFGMIEISLLLKKRMGEKIAKQSLRPQKASVA